MMGHAQNQIAQLEREVARLDENDATEAKKEANLISKIYRAQEAIGRTKNLSSIRSRHQEIDRANRDLVTIKKKRSDISKRKADLSSRLRDLHGRLAREEQMTRRRSENEQRRLIHQLRQQREVQRPLQGNLSSQPQTMRVVSSEEYDFFICHASEDKEDLVRRLAETLVTKGAKVWYDEFTLKVGDSLRQEIDRGLAKTKFGIVVLSQYFFDKPWPERELGGLSASDTRILPIWHKVSKDDVVRYSPTIADTVALNTSFLTVAEIADQLMEVLQESSST